MEASSTTRGGAPMAPALLARGELSGDARAGAREGAPTASLQAGRLAPVGEEPLLLALPGPGWKLTERTWLGALAAAASGAVLEPLWARLGAFEEAAAYALRVGALGEVEARRPAPGLGEGPCLGTLGACWSSS